MDWLAVNEGPTLHARQSSGGLHNQPRWRRVCSTVTHWQSSHLSTTHVDADQVRQWYVLSRWYHVSAGKYITLRVTLSTTTSTTCRDFQVYLTRLLQLHCHWIFTHETILSGKFSV